MTRWLVDTGILLRLTDASDPSFASVRAAIDVAAANGPALVCASQNVAEFWNAATRPAAVRGFGLTVAEAGRRLEVLEEKIDVLADPAGAYEEWKRLVVRHEIKGKQVHDARLVALMHVYGIAEVLTLNPDDFRRYPGLRVHTPAEVVATPKNR